jgi:hypothetical protein
MVVVLVAAMSAMLPGPLNGQERGGDVVPADRMAALFNAMSLHSPDSLLAVFPATDDWTYRHTVHTLGRPALREWRIPAAQTREVVNGELRRVFFLDVHAQPIGRLVHQVLHRGREWRRVTSTRFVPPGASRFSPVFVEWRREGERWVVSAVGDEGFDEGVPLPAWCC